MTSPSLFLSSLPREILLQIIVYLSTSEKSSIELVPKNIALTRSFSQDLHLRPLKQLSSTCKLFRSLAAPFVLTRLNLGANFHIIAGRLAALLPDNDYHSIRDDHPILYHVRQIKLKQIKPLSELHAERFALPICSAIITASVVGRPLRDLSIVLEHDFAEVCGETLVKLTRYHGTAGLEGVRNLEVSLGCGNFVTQCPNADNISIISTFPNQQSLPLLTTRRWRERMESTKSGKLLGSLAPSNSPNWARTPCVYARAPVRALAMEMETVTRAVLHFAAIQAPQVCELELSCRYTYYHFTGGGEFAELAQGIRQFAMLRRLSLPEFTDGAGLDVFRSDADHHQQLRPTRPLEAAAAAAAAVPATATRTIIDGMDVLDCESLLPMMEKHGATLKRLFEGRPWFESVSFRSRALVQPEYEGTQLVKVRWTRLKPDSHRR